MSIQERIEESWSLAKASKGSDVPKEPASAWAVYKKVPQRCTECGSTEIVKDGCYWCKDCHA